MKKVLFAFALWVLCAPTFAQRFTDNLDRGLVAVQPRKGSGLLLSWRIQAEEYYGVTYNLYRNGTKLNATPLTVSNYLDTGGSQSDTYTVRAVVNGVEQADSKPAKMFTTGMEVPKGYAGQPGYWYIRMQDVVDRNGKVVYSTDGTVCTWDYSINDISLADLDGDGEMEFIVKRINATDGATAYPDGTAKELYEYGATAFSIIEAYKMDGTRLWWIDCGPNMVSMNCVEINAVAYDWDEDGKAEVVMRGADNMIIHKNDGSTYLVGNSSANTRNEIASHTDAQYAWTHSGSEYLLYLNGESGAPYQVIDFPLKRFEEDEAGKTDQQVWSPNNVKGGYGHRSSKYFFGAPFLDGRHASIWLGRGIYTQTKMCALDVNRSTHQLTQRWYWRNNTEGSAWFGQGNHNMTIADVDGDGCDEIIYGSMTIDHNGKGLSTTGLGHGDAIHVGDLDPFRKGLEVFACNEEQPANNLRDATTSEILYRSTATSDDGRALMGNFTDSYPGCTGRSVSSGVISAASHDVITDYESADAFIDWSWLNGRIYWDGDLCEEYVNGPGGNANELAVCKVGTGRIMQTVNANTINDSKKNPNAQGDIIGDWREEVIMRSSDNKEIRIYSTDQATSYRIPSLWYDHQYRQAMVWQVCGYNQPPHTSFFLGELEGATQAPVPLTNRDRTELQPNNSITSSLNGKAVMLCEAGNYGIDANGASPSLLVVNVPSSVTGNGNNSNITRTYSQTQLGVTLNNTAQKGDLSGAMNFVKQGDGLLKLTARTFSYTGSTEIWEGSLHFRGGWSKSHVWMNRHTNFFCGANIQQSLTMEYGSTLYPSKDAADAATLDYNSVKVGTLNMHEGARIVFQLSSSDQDQVEIGTLNIRKKNWSFGPKYNAPVFEIQADYTLEVGRHKLGTVASVGSGSLDDIVVECNNSSAPYAYLEITDEGELDLVLSNQGKIGSEMLANSTLSEGTSGWTFTATGGNWSGIKESDPCVVEAYAGWSALALTDFQMSQSVTLDPGQYKLTGYGFYRYGESYNTDAGISKAEMYAGSSSVQVATLGGISQSTYANTTADASAAFAAGLYKNELSFTVPTTTTLEVGFRGTHELMKSWFIAGPLSLTKVADVSGATIADYEVYRLDFEKESSNSYGFQGNCSFSQYTKSDGTHCFHADQGGGSGDRTANLHLNALSTEFAMAVDYIFEFDWGHSVSNQNESKTALKCDDYATLFYIKTPGYGTSTLYDASDNAISTLTNDAYAKACPTQLSHFKISSNSHGTYLTVTYNGTTVVNNYKLADGLRHITALDTYLGRAVSHMAIDDIVLHSKKMSATLSDAETPMLESGLFHTLNVERTLKAGINSFCIPFQTTPEAVAGSGAKAWAFDRVQDMGNGTDRFYFTQVETIEPNVPYLLEVPAATSVPSFSNILLTAPAAGYVEKNGWRFVCNYIPETVLTEQNYVVKNGYLMPCNNGALTNGMRAYFVAPADAVNAGQMRTLSVCFGEEMGSGIESTDAIYPSKEVIFDVNGKRQEVLRQGVNIVRSGNGSVQKVIIK